MSSFFSANKTKKSSSTKANSHHQKVARSIMTLAITLSMVTVTGCNTTQGFKPTASVMVGGQTSL